MDLQRACRFSQLVPAINIDRGAFAFNTGSRYIKFCLSRTTDLWFTDFLQPFHFVFISLSCPAEAYHGRASRNQRRSSSSSGCDAQLRQSTWEGGRDFCCSKCLYCNIDIIHSIAQLYSILSDEAEVVGRLWDLPISLLDIISESDSCSQKRANIRYSFISLGKSLLLVYLKPLLSHGARHWRFFISPWCQ